MSDGREDAEVKKGNTIVLFSALAAMTAGAVNPVNPDAIELQPIDN